ncbi:uncharacterized protein LOC133197565 [Saccostrea echinata]|uniref:uncharacterized protein LOC133197565 n=1 Tax=Saccostrea echinata TaxID=191078 RepID=UPI002A80A6FB|nr:uncharacterized protein LOC133197565 [Saccostrea echinata]
MEAKIILTTFLLTLVVNSSKPCQQAIVLQDDTPVFISTPGFTEGKPYPTNKLCTWDISTYHGNIEVRFLSFDVEYDTSCSWDYMEIYSGPCGGNNHVKYCGTTLPPVMTSKFGRACVEFYSDPYLTKPGFKARLLRVGKHENSKNSSNSISTSSTSNTNLTSFPSPSTSLPVSSSTLSSSSSPPSTKEGHTSLPGDSSANLGGSSGTLTRRNIEMCLTKIYHVDLKLKEKIELFSPGFQTGSKYPVNMHCSVSITAIKNKILKISLLTLELEYHPQCLYDRLVVHDGPSHTSPVMLSLCGTHQSNVYLSTSDSVYVEFHSDIIIPAAGFKIIIENEPISTTPGVIKKIESPPTTTPGAILTTQHVQSETPQTTIPGAMLTTQHIQTPPTTTPGAILTTQHIQSETPPTTTPAAIMTNQHIQSETPPNTTPGAMLTTQHIQTLPTTTPGAILTTQNVLTLPPTTPTDMLITQNVHTLPVTGIRSTDVQDISTSTTATSDSQFTTEVSKTTKYLLSTISTVPVYDKLTLNSSSSTPLLSSLEATTITSSPTTILTSKNTSPMTSLFTSTPSKEQNPATKETAKSTTTIAPPTSTNHKTVNTPPLKILTTITSLLQTSPIPTTKLPQTSSFLTTILKSSTARTTAVKQGKSKTASFYTGSTETWMTKQQSSSLETESTMHKNTSSSFSSSLSSSSTSSPWTQRSSTAAAISPSKTTGPVKNSPPTVTAPPSLRLPMECLGVEKVFSTLGRHVVQSPGMKEGQLYPNDVQCSWIFIAQDNQEIKIGFEIFDVEQEKNCKYDSLQMYNGSSTKSEVIKRYCGKKTPSNFTFPGTRMYLLFKSDRYVQRSGFKLNVDIVKKPTKTKNCLLEEKRCRDGSCVPAEWFCDGEIDCPDKSDEQVCGQCVSGEFRCTNGECISTYLRCDGNPDCSGHEDEANCFSLRDDSEVLVKYNNKDLPICRDTWDNKLADLICSDQFFSEVESVWFETTSSLVHVGLKDSLSSGTILSRDIFSIVTWCPSNERVHLKCQTTECGQVSSSLVQPYILGGSQSYRGQWPWTVALMIGNSFLCGGTLVADQWVVTAGHCVESVSKKSYLVSAQIGSVSLSQSGDTSRRIMEVIRHPEHDFIYNADIALLHLQRKVEMNNYIRKACVPQQSQHLTSGLICYISGWGVTRIEDYYTTVLPDMLHHAKIKLWSNSKCKLAYSAKVKDSMFCAGYDYGGIDSCKGDSGGPLVCKIRNHWMLVGVTTWGESPCGQLHKPGVYTRVDSFTEWIGNITKSTDKVSVACDYESYGTCGHVDLSDSVFMWTRQSGGVTATGRPAVDHTFLNISGHYLYAEIPFNANNNLSPAILQLPEVMNTKVSCLSLSYVFEKRDAIKLKVSIRHKNSNDVTDVWSTSKGLSTWSTANISVDSGVSEVNVTAVPLVITYTTGVAIDDITFTEGKCKDDGHFYCDFDEESSCRLTQDEAIFVWKHKQDHQNGYMFFDGLNKPTGIKANLYHQLGKMDSPYCVKFRYKICPDATLSIHTSFTFGDYVITGNSHWSRRRSFGGCSDWLQSTIPMSYRHYSHQVTIQGVVNSQSSSIAIDDFQITTGDCL